MKYLILSVIVIINWLLHNIGLTHDCGAGTRLRKKFGGVLGVVVVYGESPDIYDDDGEV